MSPAPWQYSSRGLTSHPCGHAWERSGMWRGSHMSQWMAPLGISTRILVVERASFLMELVDLHEDDNSFGLLFPVLHVEIVGRWWWHTLLMSALQKAEAEGSLSLRPAWSSEQVSGHPGPHRKTMFQNKQAKRWGGGRKLLTVLDQICRDSWLQRWPPHSALVYHVSDSTLPAPILFR